MKTLVTKGARLLTVLLLFALVTGTSAYSQVPVSLPDVDANPGETLTVPVEVGDVSGKDINSFEFTITYDPSLISVTASRAGLSSDPDATFETNTPSPGELRVAVASATPLDGSGSLANLKIDVASDVKGTSPLSFSNFQFNEGTPSATTQDGSVTVADVFVSLPDIVQRTGTQVDIKIKTTDLSGLNVTSYQFELPFDPAVLKNVQVVQSGTISEGFDVQSTIQNGTISVAAAGTTPLEGSGTLLTIRATLGTGSTPLEFSSFQFNEGDPTVATRSGSVAAADVVASLPDFPAVVGTSKTFGLRVTDLTDLGVLSYQFTFTFDPSVVDITGISTQGTLSEGVGQSQVEVQGDSVTVAVASNSPIEGKGVLLNINADIVGSGKSPLTFRSFQFNEGDPTVATVSGLITATSQAAPTQFIHNAADSSASTVDVYFGDLRVLDDFSFRSATSFLQVPAGIAFDVGVAPGNSTSPDDVIATFPSEFAPDSSYTVVANGLLNPGNFAANPDGRSTAFDLFVEAGAEQSAPSGQVGLRAVHGATDAPTVDIDENGTTLFDNLVYGDVSADYVSAAAEKKRLVVTPADTSSVVAAFQADLSGMGGSAATVLASGFLTPSDDQNGPAFALMAAKPNGDVVVFPRNQAPTFTSVPEDFTVEPTTAIDTTVKAQDPDGDEVTYSAVGDLPEGAEIDSTSGQFTWTPTRQQGDSTYTIGVRASDGIASADTSFAIEVKPGNRPPSITAVPSGSVLPTKTFNGQVEASDPDGDPLTYALQGDPQNASIVDTTGAFTFSPPFSQRGSDASFTVQVSDGTASVDSSFTITVEGLNRQPISVNINQTFGDATVQENYLIVGLPGQVDLPIDQTLEGKSGKRNTWRAFWDNGSSTEQAGLVEFDGSSTFDFRPGRGFWVLSRKSWVVQKTFDFVSLSETGNATIPLHDGWNIISNPLGNGPAGGTVSWSAVQSENGIDEPLYAYNEGFSTTSSFASAKNGEAYYFLNSQGLSELKIPYFGTSSSSATSKDKGQVKRLSLKVTKGDEQFSSIHVGLSPSAKTGKDQLDHFAPPNYFDGFQLRIENKKIGGKYPLATDIRPDATSGHSFEVTLRAQPGTELTLKAEGIGEFSSTTEIRLYDAARAKTYDLRSDRTIEVSPEAEYSRFVLLVGKRSFVEEKASELVPQKVTLHQNYPNPFRSQTTLKYALPEQSNVRIEVFDLLGRKVRTLASGTKDAGTHTVQWNVQAQSGGALASGTYLVRLRAGGQVRTLKVTLIK